MVLVNYDQLEQLGYYEYDTPATEDERATIERMIEREMQSQRQTGVTHPQVAATLPINGLPLQPGRQEELRPLRMPNERYHEDEEGSSSQLEPQNGTGVDMSRYTEFSDNEGIRYNNLYLTLSYSFLHQRNLELAQQAEMSPAELAELEKYHQEQQQGILNKRERKEELEERKRRQRDKLNPEINHMENRWREGVQSALDTGIERALEEHR